MSMMVRLKRVGIIRNFQLRKYEYKICNIKQSQLNVGLMKIYNSGGRTNVQTKDNVLKRKNDGAQGGTRKNEDQN